MSNPRITAFEALIKLEKDRSFSNITIDAVLSKADLDTRDKSFVSKLFYGVIERQITIDYQLSEFLSRPLKKLKPEVLCILRMGVYQILFMDKVPLSAAVNESVKLSKKVGCSYASGLINAVLRNVGKNGLLLPKESSEEYLSVKYSCPEWLIEKWIGEYGKENCIGILESTLDEPDTYIRVNTLKTTAEELISSLESEGIIAEKTYNENTLKIRFRGNDIEKLESFRKGLFHVQDMASQLCVKALGAKAGDTVFDLCSAPGGKAFTLGEIMENRGQIKAFDLYEKRVTLISKGAQRLGIDIITALAGDASVYNSENGLADCVLCDVPCSGLGIIRRKPEIKYKKAEELEGLPEIQYEILKNASCYLKKGGRLIYSTCTLSKAENEEVCSRFLDENKGFTLVSDYTSLMPHKDLSDGFFFAIMKKTE